MLAGIAGRSCTSTASSPPRTWASRWRCRPSPRRRPPPSARPRAAHPGLARALQLIAHRPAQRRRARMELHAARHERPRAARRRAAGLRPRGLGPLHQHQRPHARRDRHRRSASRRPSAARCRRARSEIGLDPAYVYGLIRQESRFVMDARSGVGASRPDAAHAGHRALDGARRSACTYTPDMITDRDTNLRLGTQLPEAGARRLRRLAGAGRRRLQRRPEPAAPLARRPGARAGDLGREHPVQRDARLRQEGAVATPPTTRRCSSGQHAPSLQGAPGPADRPARRARCRRTRSDKDLP